MRLYTLVVSSLILTTSIYAKNSTLDNESLKLMYDSFIYSQDLNHAYLIAKKALKAYPDSLYWHKKIGEVALWTSKNDEAMEHLIYVYQHTNDDKLANALIKQMLATYQYKKALPIIKKRLSHSYNKKNIQTMIEINDKVGKPEDSIKTLKKLYKKRALSKYLAEMLTIYIDIGKVSKAKGVVKKLERSKTKDLKSALALSKYYFLQKDIKKAYKLLLDVKYKAKKSDIEYFRQLSDLGWYLHDKNNAVYGSLMLYHAQKARLVDYERIEEVYRKKDIALMKDIANDAMKRHGSKKFLINYANQALEQKDFKTVQKVISEQLNDPKSLEVLKSDPNFWLIKAKIDKYFNRKDIAHEEFKKALTNTSNSPQIVNTILWSLIDNSQYTLLDKMIKKIEKQKNISPSIYHALSAAYLTLQKPDKAMVYFNKVYKNNPQDMDLLFLQTEIYAAQGDIQKQKTLLRKILNTLKKEREKNPSLIKDKQYLRRYLQASLWSEDEQSWKELLNNSKKYLTKSDYYELQILNALKHKRFKEAKAINQRSSKHNPQLEIELAYENRDNKLLSKLINNNRLAASKSIIIEEYIKKDDISQAINYNKEALNENSTNPYLIDKLHRLYRDYNNHIDLLTNYATRGSLKTFAYGLSNFYYISNGYGLISNIKEYRYKGTNLKEFKFNKCNHHYIDLGVRKSTKDSFFEAGIIYQDREEKDFGIKIEAQSSITDSLYMTLLLQTNSIVNDQSIQMQIGGTEDLVSIETSYTLTDNQYITILGEHNRYASQDGADIGSADKINFNWDYTFSKYKDKGVRLFYNTGKFDEKLQKGNIKDLLYPNQSGERLLQKDYEDTGITLYYKDSSKDFGNRLNPYIDLSAIYSKNEKRYYTTIHAGVTKLFLQTNLIEMDITYQNSINTFNQKEFTLNLKYTHRY
jgi:predicted Zn-dependent protease